jgi:U3 small nucleolar RNA-associated protein 14
LPADASFRNLTRPAVLKDAGVIIEPIRYSKHLAEEHHGSRPPKASKRPAVSTVAGGMPKRSKAAKK